MKKTMYHLKAIFVWTLFAALAVSVTMMTTACGQGQKLATTPGDSNHGRLLNSALGFYNSSGFDMELGIDLMGQGSSSEARLGRYDQYHGSVTVRGMMAVHQSGNHCSIPLGEYTLETEQKVQWNNTMRGFYNMKIIAHHTSYRDTLRLTIKDIILTATNIPGEDHRGHSYPYGLMGTVVVTSINGVACSPGNFLLTPLNQFFFSPLN